MDIRNILEPWRRRRSLMAHSSCLALLAFLTVLTTPRAEIEIMDEFGCHNTEFRLRCRHVDSSIAILDATFSARDASSIFLGGNVTCAPTPTINGVVAAALDEEPKSIRLDVNKRCSGLNVCSFNLQLDRLGATLWGPGLVTIKYACVNGEHLHRFCSDKPEKQVVRATSEGFLMSPGYPHYIIGDRRCLWRLRADTGQRLIINVLDLSLRAFPAPSDVECLDQLTVGEFLTSESMNKSSGSKEDILLSTCGDTTDLPPMEVDSGHLDVQLLVKGAGAHAKRGILIHYKGLGCATPRSPADGYLVHRNETTATYMCCVGYVFPDSGRRQRTLNCDGNAWRARGNNVIWDLDIPSVTARRRAIPDCVNVSKIASNSRSKGDKDPWALPGEEDIYLTRVYKNKMGMDSETMSAVVLPICIMMFLFIANAVILYGLHRCRRRCVAVPEDWKKALADAEAATAAVEPVPTSNPHPHPQGSDVAVSVSLPADVDAPKESLSGSPVPRSSSPLLNSNTLSQPVSSANAQ